MSRNNLMLLDIIFWYSFYPSKTASKAIVATIKQQFDEPWLTWGQILKRNRGVFFKRFKVQIISYNI